MCGSYAQIRDFLNRALAEIPALSLDQMTLRRDGRNEAALCRPSSASLCTR